MKGCDNVVKGKQRLDKVLGHMGIGTRSELKKLIKAGRVQINGVLVKDNGLQISPEHDHIEVDGETVHYREFIYIMLNKPQGVVSATEDSRDGGIPKQQYDDFLAKYSTN